MTDGCFRQVEFAGVLAAAAQPQAAAAVLDLMLSEEFQADVPLSMFVYPVRSGVELPELFQKFAAVPAQPLTMSAADIAANRDRWLEQWNEQG
jgi:thiamine transport system substrate-binding protein